jgi:hypothetical protein
MFSLVLKDLDTSDLLDINFYAIRECGYNVGLHFNQSSGFFNVGIERDKPFSFRMADNKLYLTGDLEIPYSFTPMYYIEDTIEELL